jgi:hypothetical protein
MGSRVSNLDGGVLAVARLARVGAYVAMVASAWSLGMRLDTASLSVLRVIPGRGSIPASM